MNLKTFIAETLKEIIDGVIEANSYYAQKGGSGNPKPTIIFSGQAADFRLSSTDSMSFCTGGATEKRNTEYP